MHIMIICGCYPAILQRNWVSQQKDHHSCDSKEPLTAVSARRFSQQSNKLSSARRFSHSFGRFSHSFVKTANGFSTPHRSESHMNHIWCNRKAPCSHENLQSNCSIVCTWPCGSQSHKYSQTWIHWNPPFLGGEVRNHRLQVCSFDPSIDVRLTLGQCLLRPWNALGSLLHLVKATCPKPCQCSTKPDGWLLDTPEKEHSGSQQITK